MKTNERTPARFLGRVLKKLALLAAALFAGTFLVYMFNLENKLIYRVVYPFQQKHYDAQKRDRRI